MMAKRMKNRDRKIGANVEANYFIDLLYFDSFFCFNKILTQKKGLKLLN